VNETWTHDKFDDKSSSAKPLARSTELRSSGGAPRAGERHKIKITNLNYTVDEKDLKELFGSVGTVVGDPKIKYDMAGRSTGEAFVELSSAADAENAKKQYDGKAIDGVALAIEVLAPTFYKSRPEHRGNDRSNSHDRPHRGSRGGRGGGRPSPTKDHDEDPSNIKIRVSL